MDKQLNYATINYLKELRIEKEKFFKDVDFTPHNDDDNDLINEALRHLISWYKDHN